MFVPDVVADVLVAPDKNDVLEERKSLVFAYAALPSPFTLAFCPAIFTCPLLSPVPTEILC